MGVDKGILQILAEQGSVNKAEDPEAYKKLASKGVLLGHPVTIKGQTHRSDNGIQYHVTIKFFNPEKDRPSEIHKVASNLDLTPPDPKEVQVTHHVLKDRLGNDVYAIGLQGKHAEKLKEHHDQFSHMGHKENYEWKAHISVPKEVHDEIKASGVKTAYEAGIEFGNAQLKRGPKVLAEYKPKLVASEALEKGALKNLLTAGAIAGAIAAPTSIELKSGASREPASISRESPVHDFKQNMISAIKTVESSDKKGIIHHKPTSRGTAYGSWGLMPDTIHDTIRLNPDLKRQHGKAMALSGEALHRYMQDNPELEKQIVSKHIDRLVHHFGEDATKVGYAWNQGITRTNKHLKQGKDIGSHKYTQKIKSHYGNQEQPEVQNRRLL